MTPPALIKHWISSVFRIIVDAILPVLRHAFLCRVRVAIAMRNAITPVLVAALDVQVATHGTLAVAVAVGITPDTLRGARRGHRLNGGTVSALTAYVASTHPASERRAA